MTQRVEIFYGHIGTVRNEMNIFIEKHVKKITSISQSVTATASHSNPMLTVIMIYIPLVISEGSEYQPIN